jgi:hypothetical protein
MVLYNIVTDKGTKDRLKKLFGRKKKDKPPESEKII